MKNLRRDNLSITSCFVLSVATVLALTAGTSQAASPSYCYQYARLAVHEAEVLSKLSCFRGFDNTWHLDYQRHYDWCLTATAAAAAEQRDYRRMRLTQCGWRV
jgi:hypothetical protein